MTVACLGAACLDSTDNSGFEPAVPEIAFDRSSLTVESIGGEQQVALSANLPWRVKTDASWVVLSTVNGPGSGTVKFTVQRNRTRDERKATITAYITDDSRATLSLVQQPADVSENFTYYVKTDGDALASGLSWEEATTLPTALENAGDGDVICLAAGTYTPVALLTGGETEPEKTFEIHSNFTLEGGYPADAVTGAVADPAANETVLSGNLGAESVYHVVTVTAAKSTLHTAVLKNLTISDGVGYDTNEVLRRFVGGAMIDAALGGGLFVGLSNLEVVNCRITGNEACHSGGVHVYAGAEVDFEGCTIANNTAANNAGGIWNSGAVVYMNNCTVSGNVSGQQAAGFYSIDSDGARSISRISNTTFSDNDNTRNAAKRSGGAAYIRAGSDAVFTNCTFTGNKAGYGGGIVGHGTASQPSATLCISCTFTGNLANDGGGALFAYNNYADITARNSILSGNTGPAGSEETGVLAGVDASHVRTFVSVVGSGLLDADGSTVGGWSFDASTMLGELGFHAGGVTRTRPLVVTDDNPAVGQGMSVEELKALAATCTPVVSDEIVAADQNGTLRNGRSIGAVTAQ